MSVHAISGEPLAARRRFLKAKSGPASVLLYVAALTALAMASSSSTLANREK